MYSGLNMEGFLSLPNEVIELIGKQVIGSPQLGAGLQAWCHLTTTCKRLYAMQLPGSAFEWSIELDFDPEGESPRWPFHTWRSVTWPAWHSGLADFSRCTMGNAAHTINTQIDGQ